MLAVFSFVSVIGKAEGEIVPVSYDNTTGTTMVETGTSVVYMDDIKHADILTAKFGEGLTITDSCDTINFKGHVVDIYRLNVTAYYSDGSSDNCSVLFDSTGGYTGLIEVDENGYFEYHGNFGFSWLNKTIVRIGFQCYTTKKTENRIGELQMLGLAFDADGSYSSFGTLYDNGGETEPVVLPETKEFTTYELSTYALTDNAGVYTFDDASASITVTFDNLSVDYKYLSIKYKKSENATFSSVAYGTNTLGAEIDFDIAGAIADAWNATHEEYEGYTISTIKFDGYLSDNSVHCYNKVIFFLSGAAGATIELADLEFTKTGAHHLIPYDSEKEFSISKFTSASSAYQFSENEKGEQVITYSTKPGYELLQASVENHNVENTRLIMTYSSKNPVDFGFKTGFNSTYTSHKRFPAGDNVTIKVDISKLTTSVNFTFEIYVDCNYTAENWSANEITIHSVSFDNPTVFNPQLPTEYSEIETSKTNLISKNQDGDYVISYDADTKPGWSGFDITIINHDPSKTQLNIVYSADEDFALGVNYIAGKDPETGKDINVNEGHLSYFAAKNRTIKLDLSDKTRYTFGAMFTLTMYFDASEKNIVEKNITIHSFEFVTPDPEPTEFTINEPVGKDGVVCRPSATEENKWVASYTIGTGWGNIQYDVHLHDSSYDVIYFSLNTAANTNLGLYVTYELNGETKTMCIRDHDKEGSLITTAGDNVFAYWLAGYGLENAKIKAVKLYFDNPTSITVNEGAASVTVNSFTFLQSAETDVFADLDFSLENTKVTYNGETAELNVVCDEEVEFKYQHALIVEGSNELKWYSGIPKNAGKYMIRVIFAGSSEFKYEVIEAELVIEKAESTLPENALVVNQATGEVTVAEGVIASTSKEFEEGYEVVTGDFLQFETTVYYYLSETSNYKASATAHYTYVMTLEQYKESAIDYLEVEIDDYEIDVEDYIASINAATDEDAVDTELSKALAYVELQKVVIDAKADIADEVVKADYLEAEQTQIDKIIADANKAIEEAVDADDIEQIVADAKEDLAALWTAQDYADDAAAKLLKAQNDAKKEIAELLDKANYRDAQKAEIDAAIAAGNEAIEDANTIEAVTTAKNAAIAALNAIKTDAQLDKEEADAAAAEAAKALKAAKEEAIAKVVAEIGSYNIDKASYESSINAAETIEAVSDALDAAKADIAAKKAAIDEANKPAPAPEPTPTPEPAKKGCKGSLVASIFGMVALLGACLTFKRKKD